MKRIVTIQDISCIGKCSLTVALPIISACGVECAIMPSSILSTHTMFKDWTFRDLTEDLPKIAEHWQKEGFKFDAIYTGYLGSARQIDIVKDFIKTFKGDNTIVFVDPVMADNGKLYPGFSMNFVQEMKSLVKIADVVVPNLTEASLLCDKDYRQSYDEKYIEDMLDGLLSLGAKNVALTGVSYQKDKVGISLKNNKENKTQSYFHKKIPVSFHGTGDIFSSSCLGALENGFTLFDSLKIACEYTLKCIEGTLENPEHVDYGVEFEKQTSYLLKLLKK